MRDGYHPDYHDERFFEEDRSDEEPAPEARGKAPGPARRMLSGAARSLRDLIPAWAVMWALAALACYVVILWVAAAPRPDDGAADWRPVSPFTRDIPVPAPPGWPGLPVTVLDTASFGGARLPSEGEVLPRIGDFAVDVPAPSGWPALPLDGSATLSPFRPGAPYPSFAPLADVPSIGAKLGTHRVLAGDPRPIDRLGAWLGAPTRSIEAHSEAWGGSRILPLAFFAVEADGTVSDAMPSSMEWLTLALAALAAWAAGTAAAWLASHEDQPFGLPWAGYESDGGRRVAGFVSLIVAAAATQWLANPLAYLVMAAAVPSFGASRAARARWQFLAASIAAACLALTVPFVEPIPELAGEYGALGVRAWDMLGLAALAAVALGLAIPRRDRTTHVTVQERPAPLVQDVRIVSRP